MRDNATRSFNQHGGQRLQSCVPLRWLADDQVVRAALHQAQVCLPAGEVQGLQCGGRHSRCAQIDQRSPGPVDDHEQVGMTGLSNVAQRLVRRSTVRPAERAEVHGRGLRFVGDPGDGFGDGVGPGGRAQGESGEHRGQVRGGQVRPADLLEHHGDLGDPEPATPYSSAIASPGRPSSKANRDHRARSKSTPRPQSAAPVLRGPVPLRSALRASRRRTVVRSSSCSKKVRRAARDLRRWPTCRVIGCYRHSACPTID